MWDTRVDSLGCGFPDGCAIKADTGRENCSSMATLGRRPAGTGERTALQRYLREKGIRVTELAAAIGLDRSYMVGEVPDLGDFDVREDRDDDLSIAGDAVVDDEVTVGLGPGARLSGNRW